MATPRRHGVHVSTSSLRLPAGVSGSRDNSYVPKNAMEPTASCAIVGHVEPFEAVLLPDVFDYRSSGQVLQLVLLVLRVTVTLHTLRPAGTENLVIIIVRRNSTVLTLGGLEERMHRFTNRGCTRCKRQRCKNGIKFTSKRMFQVST